MCIYIEHVKFIKKRITSNHNGAFTTTEDINCLNLQYSAIQKIVVYHGLIISLKENYIFRNNYKFFETLQPIPKKKGYITQRFQHFLLKLGDVSL